MNESNSNAGLVTRSINYLFNRIRKLSDSFSIRLSILEIYNENLIDLLREPTNTSTLTTNIAFGSTSSIASKLSAIETPNGVIIPNLYILPISNEDEAMTYLFDAFRNRVIGEHQLNNQSSRSHILYTFYVTKTKADEDVEQSKLVLVDLAGSEQIKKTGSSGVVQKEAAYINKSLSFLEQVTIALSNPNRDHIPYRQSKLTMILKESLGGNCKTLLIGCIWPSIKYEYETLSTLRFATRMKCIENHPIRNSLFQSQQVSSLPTRLRNQIQSSKREDNYDSETELSKAKLESLFSQSIELLKESPNQDNIWNIDSSLILRNFEISSSLQAKHLANIFRAIIWESCNNNEANVNEIIQRFSNKLIAIEKIQSVPNIVVISPEITTPKDNDDVHESFSYKDFLQGPGKEFNSSYNNIKEEIKSNKLRQKNMISELNRLKALIDSMNTQIQEFTETNLNSIDEEKVLQLLKDKLNSTKLSYRNIKQELDLFRKQLVEMENVKKDIMTSTMKYFEEYQKTTKEKSLEYK